MTLSNCQQACEKLISTLDDVIANLNVVNDELEDICEQALVLDENAKDILRKIEKLKGCQNA